MILYLLIEKIMEGILTSSWLFVFVPKDAPGAAQWLHISRQWLL